MHDCLSNCLFNNDLNYINQTEFRKILSTETTLANLIDSLQFNLDCDRVNGMVTVDYKKTFYMVDHSILLTKLEVYRLDPSALAWFRCYLNDRNCSMLHLRVTHPQGPSHQGYTKALS